MDKTIFVIFKSILFAVALLLLAPNVLMRPPGIGLDPSYHIGVSLAIRDKFTFGTDIIFTYGPLGYLYSRLPIAVDKTTLLLWDAFTFAITAFALFYIFRYLRGYLGAILAFVAIFVFSRSIPPVEVNLLLFLFLIFHYLREKTLISLLLAALLSLLLFYIKLSIGLVAIMLMALLLAYLFTQPSRYSRKTTGVVTAAYLLLLPLSAALLNTSVGGYVWGGIQLIGSFNDAMYIYYKENPVGEIVTAMALAVLVPFFLVFVANLKRLWQNRVQLIQYTFTGAYIFVLFKYGFVRMDQHVLYFFQSISMAVGLLCFFAERPIAKQLTGVLIIALLMSMPYATRLYSPEEIQQKLATVSIADAADLLFGSLDHIEREYNSFVRYLAEATDPAYPPPASLNQHQLPPEFLATIGDSSIDIIPWEISYIYANDLTYNPRPVIQSYHAYNGYLDNKNYEKYVSDTAPEFVLYMTGRIDNRHPFFTESKTKLALLTHYQWVDQYDDMLLLQKRDAPIPTTQTPVAAEQGHLNEYIPLPGTDDLLYLSADVQYSLWGQLMRLLYQPPPLLVTVQLDNGEEQTYQAITTIIKGGVLANHFASRTKHLRRFFTEPGQTGLEVTALKFHSPEAWGFNPQFRYQLNRVTLQQPPER